MDCRAAWSNKHWPTVLVEDIHIEQVIMAEPLWVAAMHLSDAQSPVKVSCEDQHFVHRSRAVLFLVKPSSPNSSTVTLSDPLTWTLYISVSQTYTHPQTVTPVLDHLCKTHIQQRIQLCSVQRQSYIWWPQRWGGRRHRGLNRWGRRAGPGNWRRSEQSLPDKLAQLSTARSTAYNDTNVIFFVKFGGISTNNIRF